MKNSLWLRLLLLLCVLFVGCVPVTTNTARPDISAGTESGDADVTYSQDQVNTLLATKDLFASLKGLDISSEPHQHATSAGQNSPVFNFVGNAWPLLIFLLAILFLIGLAFVKWVGNLRLGLITLMQTIEDHGQSTQCLKREFYNRLKNTTAQPLVETMLHKHVLEAKND